MNQKICRTLADNALESYNFGRGVNVEDIGGWQSSPESSEVVCRVFLKFDDDSAEDGTHEATFTVSINEGIVIKAYCAYNGDDIGIP